MQGKDQADVGEDSRGEPNCERLERALLARGRRQQRAQLRAAEMLSPWKLLHFRESRREPCVACAPPVRSWRSPPTA